MATGPSPPRSDQAAEPRSVLRPGPTGPRLSDPEEQGQRASSAAGYRQLPSRFSADTWGQRPGWGEGHERETVEEGRPPGLRGIPERSGAGGRSRLQPPLSSRPLPITLPVGFLSPSPPPTGSGAGAAQRKSISRRQLRPALAKQPPGGDGERPSLRITDEVVPSSWRFYSSRPSQSASAPPPGRSQPFPHFGDQPIADRGIMGDVVRECGRGGTCFWPS